MSKTTNITLSAHLGSIAEKRVSFDSNRAACLALRNAVLAGESSLTLRNIAEQIKQKHHY